jgi:hypothetical protein
LRVLATAEKSRIHRITMAALVGGVLAPMPRFPRS